MGKINIYKASAGTGKTRKLTYEYISLLFKTQDAHPHRAILAVTFTNKATNEMKERIVKELNALANYATLSDKEQCATYMQDLRSELGLSEQEIIEKSVSFLNDILNDYTNFNISTNDTFFQRILRAFARELGLPSDYGVELDGDLIVKQAVETLLFELKKDSKLYSWLCNYLQELLDEDVDWKIEDKLVGKATSVLFTESFKQLSERLLQGLGNDKLATLTAYQSKLKKITEDFESDVKAICEKAQQIMLQNGLECSDFKGKNSFAHYFEYDHLKKNGFVPSKTFKDKAEESAESWYSNKDKAAAITNAYNAGLSQCAAKIANLDTNDYFSAKAILSNIYFLGVISTIIDRVNQLCADQNKRLLSDSNEILNKIIDDCDTPFIYEKTGVNIHHFLLDEFQDTSEMQWKNFQPLLANSLGEGHDNLIVGDAKQSIYHWRNSDWRILQEKVEIDFRNKCNLEPLNDNWRSAKNIINFNNMFFDFVQRNCGEDFAKLYKGHFLHYPKQKSDTDDGYVKVDFVSATTNAEYLAEALQRTSNAVNELRSKNYAYKDITILVRKGDEAKAVANYLIKENIPVVSDDALLLVSSVCVRLLVATLHYLLRPEEVVYRGQIELLWHQIDNQKVVGSSLATESTEEWEKRVFGANNLQKLRHQPLVNLVEELVWLYNLPNNCQGELTYILTFQDMVFNFVQNQQVGLLEWLDFWDKKGQQKTLPNNDNLDAVRVMTIHKSKGLASEAIIVPFCYEKLVDTSVHKQPTLWCKTEKMGADFSTVPVVPIKANSSAKTKHFADDIDNEYQQRKIEVANLYYVAFTRAKRYMYIIAEKNEKDLSIDNASKISDWLQLSFQDDSAKVKCCTNPDVTINLHSYYNEPTDCLEIGELKEIKQSETSSSSVCDLHYYENREMPKVHERYEDEKTLYGTTLHAIFSQIKTLDDVSKVVQNGVDSGQLKEGEKQSIVVYAEKLINSNEQTKDWFSGRYDVKNELSILVSGTKKQRPDRIMLKGSHAIVVDYKFGETTSDNYKKQVLNYMRLLGEMGYTTEGYLWYTTLGKIVKVS